MLLLDTNILSEIIKPAPNPFVLEWADQKRGSFGTTAICLAELAAGVAQLPEGRRKSRMVDAVDAIVLPMLDYVVPFDDQAARVYGQLAATLKRNGTLIGAMDTMIASVALANDATLVTRNVKHFSLTTVKWENPFTFG